MTLQLLAAETIDLPQLAAGAPPIIDVTAHTAHASTTFLYVVLAANTGGDPTNVPTSISATWNGVALTEHLNNFSANFNRPVAWTGYLRAPATGARTLRFTFDKIGQGFSATIYDMSGVLGSGSPFGAGSSQIRDESTRAANTASSLSLTTDAAGQSAVIAVMNLAGNGVMTYTAVGFTTVATGELGSIPGNTGGKSQQTHRYLLNASGSISVSQTCTSAARRHGITLVEILPAASAVGASLSESTGVNVAIERQLAAGRSLSEAVLVDVGQSGAIRGTGSPERPAATWIGAAQVYDPAMAKEIKSGRALTVTGVGPTVLSDGRPAGSFPHNAASLVEAAPSNLALSAYTIEGWIEATTRGTIICIGTPGTSTADLRLRSTNLNGAIANCYLLSRTTSSGTQFSTSAADTAVLNAPQHLVAVWPANGNPSLYINGELAALDHSGAVSSGPIVIGSSDQVRIGDPAVSGLAGMVGKIARINIWPTAWSATRAKITYRQQSDAVGNYGLSGENLLADTNKSPVAVSFASTATSGVAKTLDPRTFGYDPNGDTMSLSGTPTAPAGHGITVAAGNIVYTPPPSFSGVATLNFALRDPGGKVSPAIIRVTVTAPVVTPPQTDSILPASFNYNGNTTTVSGTSAAQAALNNATYQNGIITLEAGVYGTLTIPAGRNVWLRGAVAPFTDIDCTPFHDDSVAMTSATDHSPRDKVVSGLANPSNLARFADNALLRLAENAGSVRISHLHWIGQDPTAAGGASGQPQVEAIDAAIVNWDSIRVHDCWFGAREARQIGITLATPSGYQRQNGRYVQYRTIHYGDSRLNPEGGFSSAGEWCDYGTIIHGNTEVYIEDCVYYGGYNHHISFKGHSGTNVAKVNRCVFAGRNQQNSQGNYNCIQFGQNHDSYNSGGSVGDLTIGQAQVTNCTFIGFAAPQRFRQTAVTVQNVVGVELSGCIFHANFDIGGTYNDQGQLVTPSCFMRGYAGDTFSGGSNAAKGTQAWTGGINIHDCQIYGSNAFRWSNPPDSDYANGRFTAANNSTPGNGILLAIGNHPVTLGANSGFRTS